MTTAVNPILQFVEYARTLKGDEKGEAQVFCDRLFQAFGHGGYKEAGATLEFRVKSQGKATKFADLLCKSGKVTAKSGKVTAKSGKVTAPKSKK